MCSKTNTLMVENKFQKIIGIDARLYGEFVSRGIGRYVKEVVDGLIKKDIKNKYVVFLCGDNYNEFDDSLPHVEKVLVTARWYSLREQIEMPFLIKKNKIDLMHFPHFNVPIFCTTPFIVTIHDLILTKFPTKRASTLNPILYSVKNFFYKITILKAVKKSLKIIAVSGFTKSDLIEQFNTSREKIEVIYEGVSSRLIGPRNDDNISNLRYNINEPFLLYVGSAFPHKNLEMLVRVFTKIEEENACGRNLNLVITGKDDYFLVKLKNFSKEYSSKIYFPGFVSNAELALLYKKAKAYIFPSLYEGFGLPPLEAMSHGCPVVSSNASVLPEILGDAALYFDPYSEDDLKAKIIKIVNDGSFSDSFISKGYHQVKKYSWEDCLNKTHNLYLEILIKV